MSVYGKSFCLAALLTFFSACQEEPRHSANRPPPLSEHQALTQAGGTGGSRGLPMGADCRLGRSSACASGLCLKTSHDRTDGYRCSRGCSPSVGCDQGWTCQQVYPSEQAWFCVPNTGEGPSRDAGVRKLQHDEDGHIPNAPAGTEDAGPSAAGTDGGLP